MLIANAWKEVYERFDNILMMDVVDHIKDIDPIVIDRPEKEPVYVRLLGDICPQDGLAVYFSAEDFCKATQEEVYLWCEGDAGLCMQTGILGLFGKEDYVSRYNKNILQELGIHADEEKLVPYFCKMEYGYQPGKVTSAQAEELVDILMHVERLLTEIGEIEDVPEGKVLLRQYDAEAKQWINTITGHPIVEWMDKDYYCVSATEAVEAVHNMPPNGTWYAMLQPKDDECLQENGKQYHPLSLTINTVRGSSVNLLDEKCFSPAELKDGALYAHLCDLMQKHGKPVTIQYDDEPTMYHLRAFCEAVGIRMENHAGDFEDAISQLFQNNRDTIMDMLEKTDGKDSDSIQKLEQFLADAFEKQEKATFSYVFSVSLGTGLYRHIRISAADTLEDLHYAILDAFGFEEDGHLYAFTLPGKKSYVSPYADSDKGENAAEHTIAEVLQVGSKCTYTFDFGDNWVFTCKVLRQIEEPTETPVVIRKKGENPVQYPNYNEEE